MVKKERKICLKMLTTDQVRRIKLKQLKKKYRYSTGGSGRRFLLGFALRQLRSHGKRGTCKKVSPKRGAVWTIISTSQATDSFSKDDYVEEEDISEVASKRSLDQKEDSFDNDKVKDTSSDQFLLPVSFVANGARTSLSGSQNLLKDDSRTSAWSSVQCPLLETTQFFNSFKSKGLQFLEDIEAHVSTQDSNCHHPPLKNLVFGEPLHGTTPLLLACHYGSLSWVTRILEDWNVDVNAAGVYFFDPLCRYESKIARATPLFVAAFNGHTSIVKYLVRKGADVAYKTSCEEFGSHYDGMTPLYGALNQRCVPYVPYERMTDVNNMVRFLLEAGADPNDVPSQRHPIWTSPMCGVNATTALIDHGLDLEQLGSLLHHWVNAQSYWSDPYRKRDSIDVVKLLVQKGASIMAKDNKGFSMLLAAVKNQNWNCVDYFLEKEGVDPMEKIEAAEMAGAIILSTTSNKLEFERAFKYWRLALRLRQTEPGLKQKTALILKSGQAGEWISSNQLELVINHPEEYQFQSFLVRLRICSNKTWRNVLELHQDSFSDCIRDLKKQDRLVDLFDLLWVTLETIHHSPNYEPDYDLRSMIDNVFESFITTLSLLEMNHPLLNAKTLNLPLEVMVDANDFVFSDDESDSIDSDNWSYSSSDHKNHPHMSFTSPIIRFPCWSLSLRESYSSH